MLASLIGVANLELLGLEREWRGRYYTSSAEEGYGRTVENKDDELTGQTSGDECREEQAQFNRLCQQDV